MEITLILLALAPAAAIVWYIYGRDKFEKEPRHLLVRAFFLGIFSIVPALIGSIFGESLGIGISANIWLTFVHAFFVVALCEEFAKYIFLRWFMFPRPEFNEPYDGIMYGVMVGMGFAAFENVLYALQSGIETTILRMFTAVPAHGAFGVIMGYYAGLAHIIPQKRNFLFLKGLLLATIAHGAYDFFLMQRNYEGLMLMTPVVLILSIRFSRRAIAYSQEISPFNPKNQAIHQNTIAPEQQVRDLLLNNANDNQLTDNNNTQEQEREQGQIHTPIAKSIGDADGRRPATPDQEDPL